MNDMSDSLYEELYGYEEELLKRSQIDRECLQLAYERVFGSEDGKIVLRHIMDLTRVDSVIFTGNSRTFYLLGAQGVGLAIKRQVMEADPNIFFNVEREMWESEFETREKHRDKK